MANRLGFGARSAPGHVDGAEPPRGGRTSAIEAHERPGQLLVGSKDQEATGRVMVAVSWSVVAYPSTRRISSKLCSGLLPDVAIVASARE